MVVKSVVSDRLFYQAVLAEHLADLVESDSNLILGVCGHEAETDEGVVRRHGRGYDGVDKYAFVEKLAGDLEGKEVVADEEGDDRC